MPFEKILGSVPTIKRVTDLSPIVAVVKMNSHIRSLSPENLVTLFSDDRTTPTALHWSQLGVGIDGPVHPVVTAESRGFWRADPWNARAVSTTRTVDSHAALCALVAEDPFAVGITFRDHDISPGVRVVVVDGTLEPRSLYLVARPDVDVGELLTKLREPSVRADLGSLDWSIS